MKPNFSIFLTVSFASIITGNLISQPSFGQSDNDLQKRIELINWVLVNMKNPDILFVKL
jgi:hypothetical protein